MLKSTIETLKNYRTPILYTSGSIVKSIAQLFVGFVVARYISPYDLGVWNSLSLILTYSIFLQAGLINGLNLELPAALGKGEKDRADEMAGTAYTITAITSLFALATGLLIFIFYDGNDDKFRYGIFAITILVCLGYYQSYLTSTFRSKSSFEKLSLIQLTEGIVNLATLFLVIYFYYYGMIFKVIVVTLVSVFLLHLKRPMKVPFKWNFVELKKLLSVGVPIFGLVCLDSFTVTIDRLFLIKYSDMTNVGLYSFSMYSMTLFSLFSVSVSTYIYPRMTYNYGQNGDKTILWQYVKKITSLLFLVQTPLLVIGYLVIPQALSIFFPKYVACAIPMQILLLAGYFKGCIVGANVLWSIKSWKHMIIYQILFSSYLVIFTYIGITYFEDKIEGIAYGVLAANILNFFSGMLLSYMATRETKIEYSNLN